MRRVVFTEIGMENYGPYTEPFILDCPNDSMTLITGPNGVGKTISLDSMSFTFYGVTSKGERGDDVVNNMVGKNCHTWVKFHEEGSDSYVVDRYHKHSKFKNTVHITRVGETKPYRVGHREVVTEIDRLICDRKTFTNTLMFGQKVKDFFTDLTDTDQKAIFWKLLDLLKYGFFQKTANKLLDIKEKLIQNTENSIAVSLGVIENIKQQIVNEIQKSKDFEVIRAGACDRLNENIAEFAQLLKLANDSMLTFAETNINELRENVFKLKAQLDNVGKDAKAIKKDVEDEAYKKVNELTASKNDKQKEITIKYVGLKEIVDKKEKDVLNTYQKSLDKCIDKHHALRLDKSTLDANVSGNEARIIELKSNDLQVGSGCPTCLEAITEKSINNIKGIISGFESQNDKHKKEIEKINALITKNELAKNNLNTEKQQKVDEINQEKKALIKTEQEEDSKIESRLKEVKQQIADIANQTLKEKIKDLETKAVDMNIELAKGETDLAQSELVEKKKKELETKIAEYTLKIDNLKEQVKTTMESEFDNSTLEQSNTDKQKQLKIIEEANIKNKDVKEEIKRLEFWKEAYSKSGIPSMLIDQAVPMMNKSMRKYLDLLSNGRYIVTFDTISQTKGGEYRDKFAVNILDTKTRVNNRKQLSGGQTRLIDVATILTLRDLKTELGGVEFNLFAFDEIFDALDDSNIGYVCGILNSLKANRSVLVVAHRHQDELEADTHIQLTE
jgi:DNA repair exonuclease SbcCD ATPase subunit